MSSSGPMFADLSPTRAALLVRLRESVTPALANNLLHHFTDHSVAHSDSVVQLAVQLAAPASDGAQPLNEEERTILYAACYLHDIGMHYEKIAELGVIPESELVRPWSDLNEASRRDLIRKYHHLASAKIVQLSASRSVFGMLVESELRPAEVAALCEAHCLDVTSSRYQELVADRPGVRMGLISALLRLADILDENRRRAKLDRARTLDLNLTSQVHWWRHYYTSDVTISRADRAIRLHFDFPPVRHAEYSRVVPELQVPWIKKELDAHQPLLNRNGMGWTLAFEHVSTPYSVTEVMPEDVLSEMLAELSRRRSQEHEAVKLATADVFEEARPALQREREQIRSERTNPPNADYLRSLFHHAKKCWDLGGRRAACMLVCFEFERHQAVLPPRERVETAISIARWLRADNQHHSAKRLLGAVQPLVDVDTGFGAAAVGYWRLLAEIANEDGDYPAAIAALNCAIRLADPATKTQLLSLRLEWQFLQGDTALEETNDCAPLSDNQVGDDAQIELSESSGCDLLEATSPIVRFELARWRIRCLSVGSASTQQALSRLRDATNVNPDRLAIDLFEAECLYVDGCPAEAREILLRLASQSHPPRTELVILHNLSVVNLSELRYEESFYEQADRRRLHGLIAYDDNSLLAGLMASESGRHYDAVPALRRAVSGAYARCVWDGTIWAHRWLAREYLKVGLLTDASWHTLLGHDTKGGPTLGAAFVAKGDHEAVQSAITRLLSHSALARHAQITCLLIAETADLIPDQQINAVCNFLEAVSESEKRDWEAHNRRQATWNAIKSVIPRLSQEQRGRFVLSAIRHPSWSEPTRDRGHLIRTVHRALAFGVTEAVRDECINAALTLIGESRSDIDYADAINLLCKLAQSEPARATIGAVLFESANIDGARAQIAPLFGKRIDGIDTIAHKAAKLIRLQVQRPAADEEPRKVGTWTTEGSSDGERIVTCGQAGEQELGIVMRHKQDVSKEAFESLADAILSMIADSDNEIPNRVHLAESIGYMADRLEESTIARAIGALKPLAKGRIVESSIGLPTEGSQHPLSRFTVQGVSTAELRGAALRALASCARRHTRGNAEIDGLVVEALTDPEPCVREMGYIAARNLHSLSTHAIPAILVGTQDTNANVVQAALAALDLLDTTQLADETWNTLLMCLAKCSRSFDRAIRISTAKAAITLANGATNIRRDRIAAILGQLQADPFFSVRVAASQPG